MPLHLPFNKIIIPGYTNFLNPHSHESKRSKETNVRAFLTQLKGECTAPGNIIDAKSDGNVQ